VRAAEEKASNAEEGRVLSEMSEADRLKMEIEKLKAQLAFAQCRHQAHQTSERRWISN
jgi:hypothetical protein